MNYYLLGMIVGVIFALAFFILSLFIRKKKGTYPCKYDERQMVGRGKAFQAGFFTLLSAGALCNIWDFASPLPGGSFVWNIGVLLLGVAVFAVTAIHFDAYLSLNENPQQFLATGACFVFAMAAIGLGNFHSDRHEGRIMGIINFGVGIVWIIIVAALLLHRRNSQKEDE